MEGHNASPKSDSVRVRETVSQRQFSNLEINTQQTLVGPPVIRLTITPLANRLSPGKT